MENTLINISFLVNNTNTETSIAVTNVNKQIVMIPLTAICYFGDFFCIYIIFASRFKLVPTEFFILLSEIIHLSVIKLCIIWNLAIYVFPKLYHSFMVYFTVYLVVNFGFHMTIFYYSLYHLSILNRSKIFLKIFEFTHNTRIFLIYSSLVFLTSCIISIAITIKTTIETNVAKAVFIQYEQVNALAFLALFEIVVPSFFPISIYMIAIAVLLCSRFVILSSGAAAAAAVENDQVENKRFKRNLKLIGRFTFLAMFILMGTLPQNIVLIMNFVFPNEFELLKFVMITLAYTCFINQSIMIIFVHTILREKSMEILRLLSTKLFHR